MYRTAGFKAEWQFTSTGTAVRLITAAHAKHLFYIYFSPLKHLMSGVGGPRSHGATGPLPQYQNKWGFKHQPNSKKTLKIAAIPACNGCCARCSAIIEWKRKYR